MYSWAAHNYLKWNDLKFQMLRIGRNQELKENTLILNRDQNKIVESEDVIKDLGIKVDNELNYHQKLSAAINKTEQKVSWGLKTF